MKSFPRYSQHLTQKLTGEGNGIVLDFIARLQKPTAHAACDIVQRIARSGLLNLAKLEFHITSDHVTNALALGRRRSKS